LIHFYKSSGKMNAAYDINGAPKTLYVGNLAQHATEELIMVLFNQIGPVKGCKIIRDPGTDPYCFVEFQHHQAASAALTAMNKRSCLGKEMKVNWASSPGNGPSALVKAAKDTSEHHHIFVGDLSPEIENDTLRNAFTPFGELSDCKVVKDPLTQKSKGYGFCSFIRKADAQTAIEQMNGQWLGSRSIRTNWATRKPPTAGGYVGGKALNYDEVFRQSSPTNTTVYVGGTTSADEHIIRDAFKLYGKIQEIRYFKDKGYAFCRYDNKESACSAIVACHLTEVGGQIIKCSWGKEGVILNSEPPKEDPFSNYEKHTKVQERKGGKRPHDGQQDDYAYKRGPQQGWNGPPGEGPDPYNAPYGQQQPPYYPPNPYMQPQQPQQYMPYGAPPHGAPPPLPGYQAGPPPPGTSYD